MVVKTKRMRIPRAVLIASAGATTNGLPKCRKAPEWLVPPSNGQHLFRRQNIRPSRGTVGSFFQKAGLSPWSCALVS
jgi:hypothetical protein